MKFHGLKSNCACVCVSVFETVIYCVQGVCVCVCVWLREKKGFYIFREPKKEFISECAHVCIVQNKVKGLQNLTNRFGIYLYLTTFI